MWPEILELPHLVQQHRMAEMQIGRGRIEARLDPQRPAELEARLELLALDDLVGTAADQIERVLQSRTWRFLADGGRGRRSGLAAIEASYRPPRTGGAVNYWLTARITQTRAAIGN